MEILEPGKVKVNPSTRSIVFDSSTYVLPSRELGTKKCDAIERSDLPGRTISSTHLERSHRHRRFSWTKRWNNFCSLLDRATLRLFCHTPTKQSLRRDKRWLAEWRHLEINQLHIVQPVFYQHRSHGKSIARSN